MRPPAGLTHGISLALTKFRLRKTIELSPRALAPCSINASVIATATG